MQQFNEINNKYIQQIFAIIYWLKEGKGRKNDS